MDLPHHGLNMPVPAVFEKLLHLSGTNIHATNNESFLFVTWIPEIPRKTENRISGSTRHPIVLRMQSEASIPILGYSVIGQILTGDPQTLSAVFFPDESISCNCEAIYSKNPHKEPPYFGVSLPKVLKLWSFIRTFCPNSR